jgi:hypothetical protein
MSTIFSPTVPAEENPETEWTGVRNEPEPCLSKPDRNKLERSGRHKRNRAGMRILRIEKSSADRSRGAGFNCYFRAYAGTH